MRLVSTAVPGLNEVVEPLPRPSATPMELHALCDRITREDGFRKQLVYSFALYQNISSIFLTGYFK